MRVLAHNKIKRINGCERSKHHDLPILCYAYLQEVVIENNPSDHETWSHSMPCRNPCRLNNHLTLTYTVGPSRRSVKRTRTGSTFLTNGSAWSGWSRALSLMCEVALNTIIGVVLMRKNFFLKLGGHGGSSKCYFLFMCMLRRTMIDYEFNLVSDSNSNSIRASPPGWVFGRGTVLLNSRCRCRHFWTSTSLRYG